MPLHGAGHMAQGQDDEGEENEWSGSYRLATYGRYSYCSYQICGERFPLSVKARTTALSMPVDALPLMQLPSNPLFSFFVLFVLFVFLVAWCLARAPLPVTGVQETLLTKTSSGFPPKCVSDPTRSSQPPVCTAAASQQLIWPIYAHMLICRLNAGAVPPGG